MANALMVGLVCTPHRREIYIEKKAKVITAVRETEFIKFLATMAIFHWYVLKNRMNSFFSWCNSSFSSN